VIFNLETIKDFFYAYQIYNMEDKSRMCELYLHNIFLPDPYKWNSNPYVWDVQIMDFASWLRHEELRAVEMNKYKEDELHGPLLIRDEGTKLGEVISSNNNLYLYKEISLIWVAK
jgi:hypothetical protein